MHHIAHDLLRALAVKYKDAAKLVLDACRKACVHPEEVFYMLPISEELFTFGLREPARYSEIDEHLDLFLQYSEDFFTQQMKTAGVTRDERLQTYLNNVYESESFVVNTLMTEAIPENVVAYFEYLRGKEHLRHFAEKADRMLLAKYRDVTESLILNTWAEAGVEPHVAIKMMPWSDLNPLQYRATMGSSVEIDICERFKQVMKYVRLYREHREFDDYAVAKLLHGSVPIEELWAYIMVFQRYRGEDELPYQLMKAFERIFETSAQEMELAIAIENKLLQGHTPWSSIPT
ncbi:unnamed protein product [Hyaloperonospora brassicae]|uniref:RxLR effector candidate protein n=1 Tax=Hyaloperonospora brassicae TaxID=162125 RepID=A0AAV0TFJ5_HYABA|nr:unnamed protein product [Hyaloperonospora brassicae]